VSASRLFVACAAIVTVSACGIGMAGLQDTTGEGGPGGVDARADGTSSSGSSSSSGSGGPEAGGDATNTSDGPTNDVVTIEASPVDGCKATGPEQCTNGVDDDCNGLTDCADPACQTQGYTCVVPAPNGWDTVAFDATSQAGCPTGLTQKKVDVDPTNLSAPAQCGCACTPGGTVSCENGNIGVKFGPDDTCSMTTAITFPGNDGNCNTQQIVVQPFSQVTPPLSGGTCTAAPTTTVPPTGATQGEYCNGEKAFGGGCTGGQVCALAPAGYQGCIHHGGQVACPGDGYATQHAVGTLQDTRNCSPCSCNGTPTATCAGTWTFYTSNNCSGSSVSIPADGTCHPTSEPPPATYNSTVLAATPTNLACVQPAAPSPTGSVALNGADTVCCQ
jgi:hypothetical protein